MSAKFSYNVYLVPRSVDTSKPLSEWGFKDKLASVHDGVTGRLTARLLHEHLGTLTDDDSEFNIHSPNHLRKLPKRKRDQLRRPILSWSEQKIVGAWVMTDPVQSINHLGRHVVDDFAGEPVE